MFEKGMAAAKKHALKMAPEESCGLIVKGNRYIPCENIAVDRLNDFKIDTSEYLSIDEDYGVKAVIHSHYDFPHLSQKDMESQIATNKPWGVISIKNNTIQDHFFFGDQIPKEPLVGRRFVSGLWDCYSCIRDAAKGLYDVDLPNVPRERDYWSNPNGKALFEEHLSYLVPKELRFVNKHDGLQEGDFLLFKLKNIKVWNHSAIYVGKGGLMLHHNEGYLSCHAPVGPWFGNIDAVVRPVKLGGV
jgi:proteasome lid subunit RPN8/RPN11